MKKRGWFGCQSNMIKLACHPKDYYTYFGIGHSSSIIYYGLYGSSTFRYGLISKYYMVFGDELTQ